MAQEIECTHSSINKLRDSQSKQKMKSYKYGSLKKY